MRKQRLRGSTSKIHIAPFSLWDNILCQVPQRANSRGPSSSLRLGLGFFQSQNCRALLKVKGSSSREWRVSLVDCKYGFQANGDIESHGEAAWVWVFGVMGR